MCVLGARKPKRFLKEDLSRRARQQVAAAQEIADEGVPRRDLGLAGLGVAIARQVDEAKTAAEIVEIQRPRRARRL